MSTRTLQESLLGSSSLLPLAVAAFSGAAIAYVLQKALNSSAPAQAQSSASDSWLPPVPVTRRRGASSQLTLVGAGPGSPDLLTVAGYHALSIADVVLCDRIASPALRALARPDAQYVVAPRAAPGSSEAAQAALNAAGLEALRRGARVVRLKAGDPYVFGRGGEEVAFYAAHGFAADVIPGVSSALAGPAAAGVPVTHRGTANQVLISTGHGAAGALPDLPPYAPLRTLVLLMAVGRLRALQAQLRAAGYPDATSVAIVERATQADERTTRMTLGVLPEAAEAASCAAPAVVVVGAVVDALPADWVAAASAQRRADAAAGAGSLVADD